MPAGTGLGQTTEKGMSPSELARLEYLETNEYKITYWASITTNSGTITKPTGSTIVLDALSSGVDAIVETISNGQPTGFSPVTGGGAYVTVSSFDANGNYTLSGTPSATPVALLYVITIPADQYQNLDLSKIIMPEYNNPVVQTITNGDTSHSPSSDAIYDALALKASSSDVRLNNYIQLACSDETTALTTGTAKITFRMPYAFTLTAVRASLTTAQTSGNIFTVDINESGSSILSTKITIDNTEKTSTTAATAPVISDSSLADDAEITIDIDQIGDGTAKGLKVTLIGYNV